MIDMRSFNAFGVAQKSNASADDSAGCVWCKKDSLENESFDAGLNRAEMKTSHRVFSRNQVNRENAHHRPASLQAKENYWELRTLPFLSVAVCYTQRSDEEKKLSNEMGSVIAFINSAGDVFVRTQLQARKKVSR